MLSVFKSIRDLFVPPLPPPQPKYNCAKHGEVRLFSIRFGGARPAEFCTRCLCEFLETNFPITKEQDK